MYKQTSFSCFTLLHFTDIEFFLPVQGLWQRCVKESLSMPLSPTTFDHFVCPCHTLVILVTFQTFSSLLYLLWWLENSAHWCYYRNCLVTPWTVPIKVAKSFNKCMCPHCSTDWPSPPSLALSWGLPFPWDTVLKLGQLIMTQWLLSIQMKGRVHLN